MATIKKYTYEDWLGGKVCLNTSEIEYKIEQKELFKVISWNEIEETDIPKIKTMQTELFHKQISEKVKVLKEYFEKRYTNSRMKKIFLDDEIDKLDNLLYGQHPIHDTIIFLDYGLSFSNGELQKIQNYVELYIKQALLVDHDFMHSENCPFKKEGLVPHQIYAESIWIYLEWLLEFKNKLEPDDKKVETVDTEAVEPKNPRPDIFKNGYAYNFFEELVNFTVNNGTENADFSFIFHKLNDSSLQAILPTVSHSRFIKYINGEGKFHISVSKFNFKNQPHKQAAYNTLIVKYKPLITPNTIPLK